MVVINDRNFEKYFPHGTNYDGTLSTVRFSPFPINMIRENNSFALNFLAQG